MGPRISGFCDNHQGGGEGLVSLVTFGDFHLSVQWLIFATAIEGKPKHPAFPSPLYWTGVTGLKGQSRIAAPAFH
jgi:hypothetical protein